MPLAADDRQLDAQRREYVAMLADARDRLAPDDEAFAAHGLGVTLYKIGDARGAHAAFSTSLRIWTVMRGFAEDLLAEELNLAVTAYRAGDLTCAEEGFARVRANPLMQTEAAQAETLAALAMIDARAGARSRAVLRADEATRVARATGAPDVLVRTLRTVAEASLLLGDRVAARAHVAGAQAAIASAEANGCALAAEDVLGVLITAVDAGLGPADGLLRSAVALIPAAVADANAWWDLPRLSVHLRACPEAVGDAASLEGLEVLARVVGQRVDVT